VRAPQNNQNKKKLKNKQNRSKNIKLKDYLHDKLFLCHVTPSDQGCQIFVGPNIPKREKYTK
jgi:hypothetical protein